jgi:hypothetical protein
LPLGDQAFQCLPEISHRSLGAIALAVCAHARPELRVSAPDTVFILLDGVGDMNGTAHRDLAPLSAVS